MFHVPLNPYMCNYVFLSASYTKFGGVQMVADIWERTWTDNSQLTQTVAVVHIEDKWQDDDNDNKNYNDTVTKTGDKDNINVNNDNSCSC